MTVLADITEGTPTLDASVLVIRTSNSMYLLRYDYELACHLLVGIEGTKCGQRFYVHPSTDDPKVGSPWLVRLVVPPWEKDCLLTSVVRRID
jgi:hypothetical protein